jgi:hypothetical protein
VHLRQITWVQYIARVGAAGKPVASQTTSFAPQDPAVTAAAVAARNATARNANGADKVASKKASSSSKEGTATAAAVAAHTAAVDKNATKGKVHSMQLPIGQITQREWTVFNPPLGGTPLELLLGIRISLPFFGSGFNICLGTRIPCPPLVADPPA